MFQLSSTSRGRGALEKVTITSDRHKLLTNVMMMIMVMVVVVMMMMMVIMMIKGGGGDDHDGDAW